MLSNASLNAGRVNLRRLPIAVAAAIAVTWILSTASARAQNAPDTENGHYTLSPVAGDFLRLDTRTGVVSTCTNNGGWVCRAVPDERAALDIEIGKLQTENQKLKDQLKQRDSTISSKTDAPLPKEDKKIVQALPNLNFDQLRADNQKLLAMIDRMWDRIVEMASKIQKKLSEKI